MPQTLTWESAARVIEDNEYEKVKEEKRDCLLIIWSKALQSSIQGSREEDWETKVIGLLNHTTTKTNDAVWSVFKSIRNRQMQ